MDPVGEAFTNKELDIQSLPKFEGVEFQKISVSHLKKVFLQNGIFLCLVLLGWGVMVYMDFPLVQTLPLLLVILLFFGFRFWNEKKMQEQYGFALREKDILYRRGFIFSKITVVPFNRIQHVSVSRDILDKSLNISTLMIFTAGGSGSDINIPGLRPETALRLKESLAGNITDED